LTALRDVGCGHDFLDLEEGVGRYVTFHTFDEGDACHKGLGRPDSRSC
jgi:hypothetical protein